MLLWRINMTEQELKDDYEVWSGGFSPDCVGDIEAYLTYTLPVGVDVFWARDVLSDWMKDSDG